MINLKNKYCLVTGCNGHIGYAITKKLKGLGAKVIGVDLLSKKKNPNLSLFIKINLDHKTEIKKLIKILNTKFKKIDILINNAGYVGESSINKTTDSKIFYNEKYANLNLTNSIYLTNSLVPLIKKSKSASIINICSIYSLLAYDYSLYKGTNMKPPIAYGVSKAGLMHYTKLLSTALAPGIRVNSISPGGIFRNQPKKFIKRYLYKTPLSRMGHENDVANSVIFLSSELSSYITGQNLVVDGGYSVS
jgi:NAD(P)-dependent dehydrogenase (short-subunit alcohol dehydrogenase family)